MMSIFLKKLNDYDIILASRSSRRQALLRQLDIPFRIAALDVKETFPADMPAENVAEYISKQKLYAYPKEKIKPNTILITADTIVTLKGKILGKPKDENEAVEMLQLLSGKEHEVITGVSIKSHTTDVSFSAITKVKFKELSEEEISYYIDEYQPFDKAGSYGIQEWIGKIGVEWIEGSFYNVMGLPIQRLYNELAKMI